MAMGLAACSSGAGGSGSAAPSGPFTLPVFTDQSGANAPSGELNYDAEKLAVNEINAKGGIDGHQIQIKVYNTESTPSVAVEDFSQLSSDTLITIGPDLSTNAKAMFPLAKKQNIPVISGATSDATVLATGRPWTFDTFVPAQVELPGNVDTFLGKFPTTSFASIIDTQDDASALQGGMVVNEFTAKGIKKVASSVVTAGQAGYTSEVAQIEAAHPQVVVVADEPEYAAAIINTLRSTGFTGPIFLPTSSFEAQSVTLINKSVKDVYIGDEYWYGDTDTTNQSFVKSFKTISGNIPPGTAGPAPYEAVYLAAQALEQTHALTSNASVTAKRQAIIAYLAKVANFKGVIGTFSMTSGGYFSGPATLLGLDNGVLAPIP
jgi:branched-chain amino acid transport system substrate-binding protein